MSGCFGVKRKVLLNVIFNTLEHTKKLNGVGDVKYLNPMAFWKRVSLGEGGCFPPVLRNI